MSTKQATIDYILDQLTGLDVRARKMFGEYALYCDERVVALVCDDQLYIKITSAGKKYVGRNYQEGRAYTGAKPSMLIDGELIEDREWIAGLIRLTADALPAPKQKKKKNMKKINFILTAVLALTMSGCAVPWTEIPAGEEQAAADALTGFFNDLSSGLFDEAVPKFAPEINDPEAWSWIAGFGEGGAERRDLALKNYCAAIGSCLPARVVSSTSGEAGTFFFKVRFIKPDGDIFTLGPCCGATAEEMPPRDTFDYTVKKIDGTYKVITPPQYVP